ncbi:MAG: glycosyltransferase [Myxococcota bacterium]
MSSNKTIKLDFVSVGPMRAGTTWLHEALSHHPAVSLPVEKETFFFDRNFDQPQEWHEAHFRRPLKACVGEVGASYFHGDGVPDRIYRYSPGCRMIIHLRDPVDRAWSTFDHFLRRGMVPQELPRAIKVKPEILEASRYSVYLPRWTETFGAERIHFVSMDAIRAQPERVLDELLHVLGLANIDVSSIPRGPVNAAFRPRSRIVQRIQHELFCALRDRHYFHALSALRPIARRTRSFWQKSASPNVPSQRELDWLNRNLGDERIYYQTLLSSAIQAELDHPPRSVVASELSTSESRKPRFFLKPSFTKVRISPGSFDERDALFSDSNEDDTSRVLTSTDETRTTEVWVTTEQRYLRSDDGVFVSGIEDADFFSRYLRIFTKVNVIARVTRVSETPSVPYVRAEAAHIEFFDLPAFPDVHATRGEVPFRCVALADRIRALMFLWGKKTRSEAQAPVVILRSPGLVCFCVWQGLRLLPNFARPIVGAEVVADPDQEYARAAIVSRGASLLRRTAVRMLANQCENSDGVAYVTEHALQQLYPPKCRSFSYSSIDLGSSAFDLSTPVNARLSAQDDMLKKATIAFVGNLGRPLKGLDVLLNAIAAIPVDLQPNLAVVGDGALRKQYELHAEQLGLLDRVKFHGQLPKGDAVYAVLADADLFVLPSRREGLSRAVIEAMAVGLPCLMTEVCGAEELLAKQDRVPIDDVSALASKIEQMLRSRQRRCLASERNIQRSRRYQHELIQRQRDSFYLWLRDIAEVSRSGPPRTYLKKY